MNTAKKLNKSWPSAQTNSAHYFWCEGAVVLVRIPRWCQSSSPYLSGWAQTFSRGNSFWLLVSMISFFQSLPKACDHWWGLGRIPTGKLRALTPGSALFHHNNPVKMPTLLLMLQWWRYTCQPYAPCYHHCEQDPEIQEFPPRYLNIHFGQQLFCNPKGTVHIVLADDHRLRVVTTSHSAAKHLHVRNNTITSSAKRGVVILRSPNQTLTTPWLHFEILTNKISDKGKPNTHW